MPSRILTDAVVNQLAESLSRCTSVSKYDTNQEKEAWTLAHAFSDLEQSFHTYLHDLLPRLVAKNLEASAIRDILLEIGEEFRHILYHINDSKFYEYLKDDHGETSK